MPSSTRRLYVQSYKNVAMNEDITVDGVSYSSDLVYEYKGGKWEQYVGTVNG